MPRGFQSSLIKPFVALATPGMYLFYKFNQYKRQQEEQSQRKVTERELSQLNHKIDKLLAKLDEHEPELATTQDEECVVCISSKASMQTYPCGHMVVCRKCFVKTIQMAVSQRLLPLRCVICRTKILRLKQSGGGGGSTSGATSITVSSGRSLISASSSHSSQLTSCSVSSYATSCASSSCSSAAVAPCVPHHHHARSYSSQRPLSGSSDSSAGVTPKATHHVQVAAARPQQQQRHHRDETVSGSQFSPPGGSRIGFTKPCSTVLPMSGPPPKAAFQKAGVGDDAVARKPPTPLVASGRQFILSPARVSPSPEVVVFKPLKEKGGGSYRKPPRMSYRMPSLPKVMLRSRSSSARQKHDIELAALVEVD